MSGQLTRRIIAGLAAIVALTGMAGAAPAPLAAAGGDQVVVYYFHRTLRCQTCLAIEDLAAFAITQNLIGEIERGALAWRPVNVDQEADAHFVDDFALETQALVVAAYHEGALLRWRNLEKVWDLHPTPDAFDAYVLAAVHEFIADPAGIAAAQGTPAAAR
jgi:hypothetical protein